jgi:hypothetical protein
MSATCTHCGFPMDTPERAHSFIHQLMESITEHRKLLPLLRKEQAYAEDVTAAAKRVIDECDRRQREGYKPEAPWLDLHVLRKVIADRRTEIGTKTNVEAPDARSGPQAKTTERIDADTRTKIGDLGNEAESEARPCAGLRGSTSEVAGRRYAVTAPLATSGNAAVYQAVGNQSDPPLPHPLHAVVPKYEEWSESVEAVSGLAHMTHAGVPSGLADRIMRCAFEAGRRGLSQDSGNGGA